MTEAPPEQGNADMLGKRLESSNENTGQLTSNPFSPATPGPRSVDLLLLGVQRA